MKHLLVTTDFSLESSKAFPIALDHARLSGDCRITLLAVLEDVAPTSVQFEFGLSLIDTQGALEEAHAQAVRKIDDLSKTHFGEILTTPVVVRATRSVPAEICDYAKANGVDMIVMTTHGRTGLQRLVMGSVSEGVIRESCCPVLIVPIRKPADAAAEE